MDTGTDTETKGVAWALVGLQGIAVWQISNIAYFNNSALKANDVLESGKQPHIDAEGCQEKLQYSIYRDQQNKCCVGRKKIGQEKKNYTLIEKIYKVL